MYILLQFTFFKDDGAGKMRRTENEIGNILEPSRNGVQTTFAGCNFLEK